jgi:hypothetical protein
LDERHDVEEHTVFDSRIVERQDVGMSKACRGLDLAQKAVRANGGRQLRPQYLDRDTAPMLDVFGQVDGRHATLTELTLDAVAAVQGGI